MKLENSDVTVETKQESRLTNNITKPYRIVHEGFVTGSTETFDTLEEAQGWINSRYIERGEIVKILNNKTNITIYVYAGGQWWKVDNGISPLTNSTP